MRVPPETANDDLQLFDKQMISDRSLRSVRSVEQDASDPDCPLKWTHQSGKKRACDAPTLRAYLGWLRQSRPGARRRRPPRELAPLGW